MSTTVRVRGWAETSSPAPLSVASQVGDRAILLTSDQWRDTAADVPTGWEGVRTPASGGASSRSGVVAHRLVTDPSQTQSVTWIGTTGDSRKNAILLVLEGDPAPALSVVPWGPEVPQVAQGETLLLASMQHAAAGNLATAWTDPGGSPSMVSGARRTDASWSMLRAALVTSQPDTTSPDAWSVVQAWAGVRLPGTVEEPAPQEPVADARAALADGTPVTVSAWDGMVELSAVAQVMPRGHATVEAMLAASPFFVAHRGGSASWPESSLRAYTQAVAYGADALEVSACRTADGVWVVSHDGTLNRADPSAPSTPIKQMSWDQVKQYTTFGEPLIRVEEVLDRYGDTHVIFADPKTGVIFWEELLALGFDKSRTVLKYAGDATWMSAAARAQGWWTWGFAYQEQALDGTLAQWAPDWDLLGMDYTASVAAWEATRQVSQSSGRPVLGHICPTVASTVRPLEHGAIGCMTSGIANVLTSRAATHAGPIT